MNLIRQNQFDRLGNSEQVFSSYQFDEGSAIRTPGPTSTNGNFNRVNIDFVFDEIYTINNYQPNLNSFIGALVSLISLALAGYNIMLLCLLNKYNNFLGDRMNWLDV